MNNINLIQWIENQKVEHIQRMINVDYDNFRQLPVRFFYQNQEYKIDKVLGKFQGDLSEFDVSFLVRTVNDDVYLLYLAINDSSEEILARSFWILQLKVLDTVNLSKCYKEGISAMVLTNMTLQKVSNFHGHICPNLVIGCRASQLALDLLLQEKADQQTITVIAENNTSAIDAIQCLTGCTLGNQHLKIKDFGKHKYTFMINQTGQAVIVSLKEISFQEEKSYLALEKKLKKEMATHEDLSNMQFLLDQWVSWLFSLSDQELFTITKTKTNPPEINLSSRYVRCCYCHDLVEESKAISFQGNFICQPCSEFFAHEPASIVWQ